MMGRDIKTIRLPWPDVSLHSNSRANRFKKARAIKDARNIAWSVSMEAPRIEPCEGAELFFEYYPKTYRGDVHNVASALKAYIDGIADAMGCDDRKFVVHFPTVWAGKKPGGEIVVRVCRPISEVAK